MKLLPLLIAAAALALGGCVAAGGGDAMTRQQGDAILAELRDLKRLVAEQHGRGAEAEAPARVQLDDAPGRALGNPAAPITLVEFTDYQCPFCKRFRERTWPELKARYVDTGKVRYVVRDMPLPFHAEALPAAVAVRCAAEQGKFWAAHEALYGIAAELSAAVIRGTVLALGVDPAAFDACTRKPAVRAAIDADAAEAERIGVNGTPGFVIAQSKGGHLEGTLVLGAQPTSVFTSRFDALLGGAATP